MKYNRFIEAVKLADVKLERFNNLRVRRFKGFVHCGNPLFIFYMQQFCNRMVEIKLNGIFISKQKK